MEFKKEVGENHEVTLTITVPAKQWEKALKETVQYFATRYEFPGFRPGKAPRQMVFQRMGKDEVLNQAFLYAADVNFNQIVREQKLEVMTEPKFNKIVAEEGKDLEFTATYIERPEVVLGEYKNLKIEKNVEPVTEEMVQERMNQMRDHHAKLIPVEDANVTVANGDLITLDFKGFCDGEAFKGGEAKDYPLTIGSKAFIPGFEDQLIGLKVGEEKDVVVTFPTDYQAEHLAGKEAVFKCKVNSIKHKELPELTDEFVASISPFKSVQEFHDDIQKRLEKMADEKATREVTEKALETAVSNATIDVPKPLIEAKITQMVQSFIDQMQRQGMSFDKYLEQSETDMSQMREEYRQSAEKEVRTEFMLDAVAKKENIQVEQADFEAQLAAMSQMYGATPQQIIKIVKEQPNGLANLHANILKTKTIKFIVDNLEK